MKRLVILLPNGVSTLSSLILASEVIAKANDYFIERGLGAVFEIVLAGNAAGNSINNGSFWVDQEKSLNELEYADLILVPAVGGSLETALKQNQSNIDWIKKQYKNGAEVASLCTGVFLLAAAGLLNEKKCSTHWGYAEAFKEMFPQVELAIEKIITDEHGIYTSGGAISSLNLVLYIIEKYYDRETAIYCSKAFEIDLNRNSQSEFIIFSGQKNHEDDAILKAQLFMEQNIGNKIIVDELSAKFSIDRRNFDRRFKKATGNSPLEYMQRIKIERAKKFLDTSRKTINEVMFAVGYSDVQAFRQVFRKITGLSPIEYRNKYNKEVRVV